MSSSQQEGHEDIEQVAKQLNVDHLLDLSFVKLSNGQTRRARIARALLKNPSMLVLDEPLSKSLFFVQWRVICCMMLT